jgi:hypothetical protein
LAIVTVAWGAFLLDRISDADIGVPRVMLAIVGTAVLAVVWLGSLVGRGASITSWLAWGVLPLACIAITVIFLTTQSPLNPFFRLRFLLSRSALGEIATNPSGEAVRWVALFRVQRIDRFADAVPS